MNRSINQLVGEITSLAVAITSNTEIDVFVRYSGHADLLDIDIYSHGWGKCNKADITARVNTKADKYRTEGQLKSKLERIKQRLINIARKGKIDFSKLPYETVEVKKYCLIKESEVEE